MADLRRLVRAIPPGLVVLTVPILMVTVAAARSRWGPPLDHAFLYLRVRDVGSASTPLVGTMGRLGGAHHPGPLEFWITAPLTRLFGPSGLLVMTGLLSLGWIATILVVARRLAGPGLAWAFTAALTVFLLSAGPAWFVDPWNAWIGVLPLLCLLISAPAFVWTGRLGFLVVALIAGSYAAQAHAGLLPIVAVVAMTTVVGVIVTRPAVGRAADDETPVDRSSVARTVAVAVGLTVLLWSGPLLDQFFGDGNLSKLVRFAFEGNGDPRPPLSELLRVGSRQVGLSPAWVGFDEGFWNAVGAPAWQLLVPLVLLSALTVAARRLDPLVSLLAGFALVFQLGAIVAITRMSGQLYHYLFRWAWPVSLFGIVVLAWGSLRLVTNRVGARANGREAGRPEVGVTHSLEADPTTQTSVGHRVRSGVRAGSLIVAITISIVAASVGTVRAATADPRPFPEHSRAVRAVAGGIRANEPKGTYNAKWGLTADFASVPTGVFVALTDAGWDIRYPEDSDRLVGSHRSTIAVDAPTLWIGVGSAAPPAPDARLVIDWQPAPPDEHGYTVYLLPT